LAGFCEGWLPTFRFAVWRGSTTAWHGTTATDAPTLRRALQGKHLAQIVKKLSA
jgi:hypothetical protein